MTAKIIDGKALAFRENPQIRRAKVSAPQRSGMMKFHIMKKRTVF